MIYMRRREHIYSRGSAIAENRIRKVHNALEKLITEFPKTEFKNIVQMTEDKLNNVTMESLHMTPKEAVRQADPHLLIMFSQSDKLK